MTAPYRGVGYPCRRGRAECRFRVMPASGDTEDLREAARVRMVHERRCPYPDSIHAPEPQEPDVEARSMDDRITQLVAREIDAERDARDTPATPTPRTKREWRGSRRTFICRCKVCGDPFEATGPRAQFCPKDACQEQRKVQRRAA